MWDVNLEGFSHCLWSRPCEMSWDVFPPVFWKRLCRAGIHFFLKCLLRCTSETIRAECFLFRKVLCAGLGVSGAPGQGALSRPGRSRWQLPEGGGVSPSGTRLLSSVQFHFVCLKRCGVKGAPLLVGPNCWQTRGPVLIGRDCKGKRCRWRRARPAPLGAPCSEGARGGLKHHHLGRFVLRLEGNESGNKCDERARGRLRVDRLQRLLLCVGVTSVARVSFPRRDQALLEPGNVVPSFCPSREVTQLGTSLFRVLP